MAKVTRFIPSTKPGVLVELSYDEAAALIVATVGITLGGVDVILDSIAAVLDEIDGPLQYVPAPGEDIPF